jgi:uncharacterized membrane protein YvbJ
VRKCPQCGSNLLAQTVECPICAMPDGGAQIHAESAFEKVANKHSYNIPLIVIGLLIPPLGLFFALMHLFQQLTDDDSPANPE